MQQSEYMKSAHHIFVRQNANNECALALNYLGRLIGQDHPFC